MLRRTGKQPRDVKVRSCVSKTFDAERRLPTAPHLSEEWSEGLDESTLHCTSFDAVLNSSFSILGETSVWLCFTSREQGFRPNGLRTNPSGRMGRWDSTTLKSKRPLGARKMGLVEMFHHGCKHSRTKCSHWRSGNQMNLMVKTSTVHLRGANDEKFVIQT